MRKYPDFVCVGAQKAGTTTLHDILKYHPDLYLPSEKEAHFFDQEELYAKGVNWWLDTYFSGYAEQQKMGVITPEYLFYEEVPERIYQHLGYNTKIIVILRNPVLRAYSHYLMSFRRGFEKAQFIDALAQEHERLDGADEKTKRNFSYVSRGLYTEQLKRYFSLFGRENVMVLFFESDIVENIDRTVIDIQKFIGVQPMNLEVNVKSNSASTYRFAFLNSLLRSNNVLKRIMKRLVKSQSGRVFLAKVLNKVNRTKKNIQPLSQDLQRDVYQAYFLDEIAKLEELLDLSLDSWKYDAKS